MRFHRNYSLEYGVFRLPEFGKQNIQAEEVYCLKKHNKRINMFSNFGKRQNTCAHMSV